MTPKSKIAIFFITFIMLFAGFGGLNYWQLDRIGYLLDKIYIHPLAVTRSSLMAGLDLTRIQRHMKELVRLKDDEKIKETLAAMDKLEVSALKSLKMVDERVLGDEGIVLSAQALKLAYDWRPIRTAVITLVKQGKYEKVHVPMSVNDEHADRLEKTMANISNYAAMRSTKYRIESKELLSKSQVMLVCTGILIVILFSIFAFAIARSVLIPINSLQKYLAVLQKKPHNLSLRFRQKPSLGISEPLNIFVGTVHEQINAIAKHAEEIAHEQEQAEFWQNDCVAIVKGTSMEIAAIKKSKEELKQFNQKLVSSQQFMDKNLAELTKQFDYLSSFLDTEAMALTTMIASSQTAGKMDAIERLKAQVNSIQEISRHQKSTLKNIHQEIIGLNELIGHINSVVDRNDTMASTLDHLTGLLMQSGKHSERLKLFREELENALAAFVQDEEAEHL